MKPIRSLDILIVCANLVAIVVLVWLGMKALETPPPAVKWINDSYQPVTGCPGDSFGYSIELDVTKPSVLFVATSILRAGQTNDTARGGQVGEMFVTVIPTPRRIIDSDATFEIPYGLLPGDYVRTVAAGTLGEPSEPAIREQPFTIRDDCEQTDDKQWR